MGISNNLRATLIIIMVSYLVAVFSEYTYEIVFMLMGYGIIRILIL